MISDSVSTPTMSELQSALLLGVRPLSLPPRLKSQFGLDVCIKVRLVVETNSIRENHHCFYDSLTLWISSELSFIQSFLSF